MPGIGDIASSPDWEHGLAGFRPVEPLCEGLALAEEIIAYLKGHGFRLAGQFNPSYARTDGSLLQADLLFERDFS